MLNDLQLVKQCQAGDEKALDKLYQLFSARMFGICLRYAKNRMEAEDLLHDGFIRVLGNMKEFRLEGSFEGWLRRVMVTTAINYYRKKISYRETDEISPVHEKKIGCEDILSGLSASELMRYVQELPDGYRMVFNLYIIEGYKHNEIGHMLGISENTSKTQLLKARKALQERLINEGFEVSEVLNPQKHGEE
jgi:RNA polymerase sigma factor (sigma-70 family)